MNLKSYLFYWEMVRPRGFEPPAFASGGRRSIQLSYGRMTVAKVLKSQARNEVRILKEIRQDSSA